MSTAITDVAKKASNNIFLIILLNYKLIFIIVISLITTNFIVIVSFIVCLFKICSLHPDLVFTILSDVSHPGKCLVATLLYDLEVADLHSRDSEVWDLELDLDGNATVLLSLFSFDSWETELSSHEELFAASKLLDAPDH